MAPRHAGRRLEPTEWAEMDISGLAVQWKLTAAGIVHYKWEGSSKKTLTLTTNEDVHDVARRVRARVECEPAVKAAALEWGGRDRSRSGSGSCSRSSPAVTVDNEDLSDLLGFEPSYDKVRRERSASIAESSAAVEALRFPRRRSLPSQQFSPSKGWSDFERDRVGSRHHHTRAVSYAQSRQNEADLSAAIERSKAARERLQLRHAEMHRAVQELQRISNQQIGPLNQQAAATLQQALLEVLAQEDRAEVEALSKDQPDGVEERDEIGSNGEQEPTAVLFETEASVSGVVGRAVLGSQALLWGQASADEPTVKLQLATVSRISTQRVRLSPFSSVERCVIESSQLITNLDFSSDATGRELCEQLRTATEEAVNTVIRVAAGAASTTTNNASTATSATTGTKKRSMTARQRAGAELREKLQEVVRLRSLNQTTQAAAALDAIPAGKMTTGAKGRARELSDATFTFGGLALTKDIVARFLRAPEVRLLLPEEFQQKQTRAKDAEVEKRLLEAAKRFFRDLIRVKGKTGKGSRCEEDNNAFWAAAAALLPKDLIEKRQARAAGRILGLNYQQVRRGCRERTGLEDRASGWKRVKRARNNNCVDYAIVGEAWESDLLSTPDNQNKELIKVFLGPDPVTGEQQYDLHPRRAQLYTNRMSLEKFRCSHYAVRLRETARAAGHKGSVILGKRQLVEARCPCIKRRKPSECDCLHHTFVELNLRTWDVAREGARAAARDKGISSCPNSCPIHGPARRAPLLAVLAAENEQSAWEAALAGAAEAVGADDRAMAMELATARRREADTAVVTAAERAAAYFHFSELHLLARFQARLLSCPDDECLLGRYSNCKHRGEVGAMRHVVTPLAKGCARVREGQLLSLHEFAEKLEAGMVVAVNADENERNLEGDYWLALLLGGAFECPEALVHATDVFEAGWLVVRVHWYELKQVSQRGYILKPVERVIPVNTIVRLLGLQFSNTYSAGRKTRAAAAAGSSLYFFDEDSHNLVEAACRHEEAQGVTAE